jgi:hypothetical protein
MVRQINTLRTDISIRPMAALWATLVCIFCSGCLVVPLRVPAKSISVSGAAGKHIEYGFIKSGVTTRKEVTEKLKSIDTGVEDETVFVGRWAESSWGVAWALGGGYAGEAGWNRDWAIHNLLIDFDVNGIVLQTSVLSDNDVLKSLSERLSRNPGKSLDFSRPISVPVEYIRSNGHVLGTLILSKDEFAFVVDREANPKSKYDFKISPENLNDLGPGAKDIDDPPRPESIGVTIYFKNKIAVGRKLSARTDIPTTLILLEYIQRVHARTNLK